MENIKTGLLKICNDALADKDLTAEEKRKIASVRARIIIDLS